MSTKAQGPFSGTRAKVFLVGGLVATLAGMWAPSFMAVDPARPPATGESMRDAARRRAAQAAVPRAPVVEPSISPFEPRLEETVEIDPFAVPEALGGAPTESLAQLRGRDRTEEESTEEDPQAALERIVTQRVSLVVETNRGPAARLGSRLVRVGDTIEGFEIERITKDGIYLSKQRRSR